MTTVKEIPYDPRINYWDSNPHLKFLIQNALGHRDNFEQIDEVLRVAGELSGKKVAAQAQINDEIGCKLEWYVGGQVLTEKQYKEFMQAKSGTPQLPDLDQVVDEAIKSYNKETPIFSEVVLPEGTKHAIDELRKHHLIGVTLSDEFDRPNLPHTFRGALALMMFQADASMYTIPGLTAGAAETILRFGSKELQHM